MAPGEAPTFTVAKSRKLSKDTGDKTGMNHSSMFKQLVEKRSTFGAIIRKCNKFKMADNLLHPGAPCK